MNASTFEALLIFLAAFSCGLSGYFIAFKGRRGLISGFNESLYADPEAFGKSIGISLILFSLCLTVLGYCWYSNLLVESELTIWGLSSVLCLLLNYYYSYVKYRKK